jgi:hypothetical protein
MVVSARLGNKFITSPSKDKRPCIYLYLVDDDHFHAITNITGFFSAIYVTRSAIFGPIEFLIIVRKTLAKSREFSCLNF